MSAENTGVVQDGFPEVELCIDHSPESVPNEGSSTSDAIRCYFGMIEGVTPSVGQCILLETVGESSILTVSTSEAC